VLFEYAAILGLIDVEYARPEGARTDYHQNWDMNGLPFLGRYDGMLALRLNAGSIRLNTLGANAIGVTPSSDAPAGLPTSPGSLSVIPNSTW